MNNLAEALKYLDKCAKKRRARKHASEDALQDLWHNCRLYVRAQSGQLLYPVVIRRKKEKYGYSLLLHLPVGLSDLHFRKRLHSIAWALGGDVELEPQNGKLLLRVLTGQVKNFYRYTNPHELIAGRKMVQPVPIGYGREGLIMLDLADAPHLLLGGGSGCGKSNWLHQAICTLLAAGVQVYIIDLKRLEFAWYHNHATCVHTEQGALEVLRQVEQEMDRRMELLQNQVVKIQDWEGEKLPYIVVVIDEIAELQDEKAWGMLNRLVRLARALGISIVVATQRPSIKVIDGDTRALFTARLSFRVADETNSRIILDGPQAAYLPTTKGRAIYRFGDKVREVQTMYLPVPKGVQKILSTISPKMQEPVQSLNVIQFDAGIKTKP